MPKVTLPVSGRAGIWPENVNYMWTHVFVFLNRSLLTLISLGMHFIYLTNIYREAAI